MFTQISPQSDTALSNDQVANMLLRQALDQLSKLTQLNNSDCLSLLEQQLAGESPQRKLKSAQKQLIDHQESDYIISLFN